MAFTQRHLLGLEGVSAGEITSILDTAASFKEISERDIKKVPALRGKTVINLFYESSTRTRTSFEIAAKRLSADTVNISASTSSASKGETLADTARNLEAMRPDAIVVRHPASGACHLLARHVSCPILNEYSQYFCLPGQAVGLAKPQVIILHPGPLNRVLEIASAVADGPYSVIMDQVTNGVAVRMALLYLLVARSKGEESGETAAEMIGDAEPVRRRTGGRA